ncbi:Hemin uptake protein [Polaromonas sp. CG9_12]|nr:Hemin uptake protein [Polaromonas sp. CG9_12]
MHQTPPQPASADEHATAITPVRSTIPQPVSTHSGCVDSIELLRGQKTVEISHNGSTYRLQATRLGKLILTK